MYLGIEIGGTKLQLGVGLGDGKLVAIARRDVVIADGAAGIQRQIAEVGRELIAEHGVRAVGYGFGGPLDLATGRTIKSHQVSGWDDFPLGDWTRETLGVPAVLNNDCDAAALGEARFGAGRGKKVVFYVTVGTGVGGGLVIEGQLYRGGRGIAAEIGHLRPGLIAAYSEMTVESAVAGPGIAMAWWNCVEQFGAHIEDRGKPWVTKNVDRMRDACAQLRRESSDWYESQTMADGLRRELEIYRSLGHDDLSQVTARDVFEIAAQGGQMAAMAIHNAARTLGWAIAQVITLIAPDVVVIGGGVSLAGEAAFFAPVRAATEEFVFPPLAGTYRIVAAELGEEVVVHGALAAARDAMNDRPK
jgi:glucokinase